MLPRLCHCTAMEKTWLEAYPPGVPENIQLSADETLVNLMDVAVGLYADRPAFSNLGRTLTFSQLDVLSRQFTAWLESLPGVVPGDRVAIMLPNLLQYPVALFGIWRAGMVVVNINPLYTPPELEHQLKDSGAKVLIVLDQRAGTFAAVRDRVSVQYVLTTGVGDLLGFARGALVNGMLRYVQRIPVPKVAGVLGWSAVANCPPVEGGHAYSGTGATLACLQYTGGTTGRSRGAMLSHGNLVANVRQINSWFASCTDLGQEIMVTPLPLYHVYALMCNCLCYVNVGGHNILITDPRDLKGLIAEMRRWKFTAITGVNTLYQALVQHPDLKTVDFSALKLASAGGMAVMPATAKSWLAITGVMIHEGYGLSETSPVLTSNPVTLKEYNGSIGVPLPNTLLVLRNYALTDAPMGEQGEICVKGPQVMSGYWQDAEATASSMTSDGFFRTGDVGVWEARDRLRIVDRMKDMIDVSGLKVYPNEVEMALTQHPAVLEAACIGVPDQRSGEAVKVFVVLKTGQSLTAGEVRAYLRDFIAPYKIPRQVEFLASLPKSNVGKILRRALRDPPPA